MNYSEKLSKTDYFPVRHLASGPKVWLRPCKLDTKQFHKSNGIQPDLKRYMLSPPRAGKHSLVLHLILLLLSELNREKNIKAEHCKRLNLLGIVSL